MNLYEAINHRRSVRQYKSKPIEPDKLDRLWEAVRLAPSACNLQPWKFLVLNSPAMRKTVRPILQDWTTKAPLLVIALGNRNLAWRRDGESIHAVDVAIAMEHLILAATAEGLGTCWICAFDRRALSQALQLEPEWDPVAVTPLGYPDDPSPRTPRKAASEIVKEL